MNKPLRTARHKKLIAAIAKQRQDKGMTQEEVAKAMSGRRYQSFIAKIENGERRIDFLELLRLADIIDLDIEKLTRELREIPDE